MKNRIEQINHFILLLSVGMIFSGLVYEQVVFIPNFYGRIGEPPSELFYRFHLVTNPIYYHIIPTTLILMCLLTSYLNTLVDKKSLVRISIGLILLGILTAYLVFNVNESLFFNSPIRVGVKIESLATEWTMVNLFRIGISLYLFYTILVK